MNLLERLARRMYPYRWYNGITGIVMLSMISKVYRINDGTLINALYMTTWSYGGIFVVLGAVSFQLDPKRGEMRHEIDDPFWVHTLNIVIRIIFTVTILSVIPLFGWLTVDAWLSLLL